MMETAPYRDPWIVAAGFWLTRRRGILLSPLFAVALLAARKAPSLRIEFLQDAAGLACLLGGTWLRLVAASYHDTSHHGEPITAGPYAWVRHPLYLANFLIGLGIVLFAGWWPMVAAYGLFFLPLHLLIARAEEIHLNELYGEKYEIYRRAVPAILPWRPYPGRRYGIRNEFKLRKGRERLKVLGYLCGMGGILIFKQFRHLIQAPFQQPISPFLWGGGVLLVAGMVIFRAKTRSSLIRSFQTALSTAIVLYLALHVPGVWPIRPASRPIPPVAQSIRPPEEIPGGSTKYRTAPPSSHGAGKHLRSELHVQPSSILSRFWDNVEILAGISTFGVTALIEKERAGKDFVIHNELSEASRP